MLRQDLIKMIQKNGLKETEDLLWGMYTPKDLYSMFQDVKTEFINDGWEDVFPTLRCYKECAPKYDDMNNMVCIQEDLFESCEGHVCEATDRVDDAFFEIEKFLNRLPKEYETQKNYQNLCGLMDELKQMSNDLEFLVASIYEAVEGMDCYGIINNMTGDQDIYFADTYLQCVEFLGDDMTKMFTNEYGYDQYMFEIGKFKCYLNDDCVLTDIVTLR